MYILTVSRAMGANAQSIVDELARRLQFPVLTKEISYSQWFPKVASDHDIHMLRTSYAYYHHTYKDGLTYKDFLISQMKASIKTGPKLFLGMGSQVILRDLPHTIHVRIDAPLDQRIARVKNQWKLSPEKAQEVVSISDQRRKKFIQKVFEEDWADWQLYSLCINTKDIDTADAVQLIEHLVNKSAEKGGYNANQLALFDGPPDTEPFHHEIEAEFGAILDSYGIGWAYEPRTFPLEFDDEGNITQAISPDFYLEEEDVYIELTVMNPKYMAEKRQKIKKLRQAYPEVKVILLDRAGLTSFMERYELKQNKES